MPLCVDSEKCTVTLVLQLSVADTLAGAGMAVSAGTYFSLGGALPFRAGLTALKDARKLRHISALVADGKYDDAMTLVLGGKP